MQRGWELEIGGSRPRTEMVGGDSRVGQDPIWVVAPGSECMWEEGFEALQGLLQNLHLLQQPWLS